MYAVIVKLSLRPGTQERFMPLMRANAEASLRSESGCVQFDIARDPSRPEEVLLYEVYSDAAAFALHLRSAHFLAFDSETADLVAAKEVTTYAEVIR